MKVLFLFESVLPPTYHRETISPGELRVIAAQPQVDTVFALGPKGKSFYDVTPKKQVQTPIEKKISLIHFAWGRSPLAYYATWVGLLVHGAVVCRSQKIDIIHAESPHISGIAALILGKLFNIKVVVEYRVSYDQLLVTRYGRWFGFVLQRIFWLIAGYILRHADYVAANSLTYEMYLRKRLKITSVGHYNPGVQIPTRFKKIKHEGVVVGWLGRLYKDKGPIHFLKMINLGQDWFRNHSVRFVMGGDGPEMKRLKAFVGAHHISDLVVFAGKVDRWQFLKQIDIMVNTTVVTAALEMTIVEAATAGIPSIVFGENYMPETVVDKKTGYIVPRGDEQVTLRNLQRVIKDKILSKKMSIAATHHAASYQFDNQVLELGKMYLEMDK